MVLGDSLTSVAHTFVIDGMPFSTRDADHDNERGDNYYNNCAEKYNLSE
jgi:hypothetical protein